MTLVAVVYRSARTQHEELIIRRLQYFVELLVGPWNNGDVVSQIPPIGQSFQLAAPFSRSVSFRAGESDLATGLYAIAGASKVVKTSMADRLDGK